MNLANENAELVSRVLSKCSDELEPAGPWSWWCTVQNGSKLRIAARHEEGFLHLEYLPEESNLGSCTLEHALKGNSTLGGGVKLSLDDTSDRLSLQADIAIVEEKQLADRFWWAIDGFHDGCRLLESPSARLGHVEIESSESEDDLGGQLRDSNWSSTAHGPNDFSVELDRDTAARARIRKSKSRVVASLEFVRTGAMGEMSRKALALFLLTTSSGLRLVRAYGAELEEGWSFGMQVSLPVTAATEEIDHGLAALMIAHQQCARETRALLDTAAARCYLAARDTSTVNDHKEQKEN